MLAKKIAKLERNIQSKFELQTAFAAPHVKARKLQQLFRQFDTADNGMMDINEFYGVMQRLNFSEDPEIIDALFQKYDANQNGVLDFREFSNGLFGLEVVSQETAPVRNVLQLVKESLLERSGTGCMPGLIRVFKVMDTSGNNRLDRTELMQGLETFGVNLSPPEVEVIMNHFDTDHSGQISMDELFNWLIPQMSDTRIALCKAAFDMLDIDGSGEISIEELLLKYDVSNHPDVTSGKATHEQVAQEFSQSWDASKDGLITFDEFVDYYRSMSSLIRDDMFFEKMVKRAWGLDTPTAARCKPGVKALVTHLDGRQAVYTVDGLNTIKPTETAKLKACLMRQGIKDIKAIRPI
jgi:Ca2+-binding EF-hand superfamily protein